MSQKRMRLIDADALKDYISNEEGLTAQGAVVFKEIVNEQPTIDPNEREHMKQIEWKYCQDIQPLEDGLYLLSVYNDSFDFDIPTGVTIGYWGYGSWHCGSTWVIYAWAQLPAPAVYK